MNNGNGPVILKVSEKNAKKKSLFSLHRILHYVITNYYPLKMQVLARMTAYWTRSKLYCTWRHIENICVYLVLMMIDHVWDSAWPHKEEKKCRTSSLSTTVEQKRPLKEPPSAAAASCSKWATFSIMDDSLVIILLSPAASTESKVQPRTEFVLADVTTES